MTTGIHRGVVPRVHVERIFLFDRVANRTGGDRVTITAPAG